MRPIINFLEKHENRIRAWFSRRPILYAVVGGVGVVLFWRGVWHTADAFAVIFRAWSGENIPLDFYAVADSFISLFIGFALLASTGLFVADFIGTEVITKDVEGEEKLTKKMEKEEEAEESVINKIHNEMHGISRRLKKIEKIEKQNGGIENKK